MKQIKILAIGNSFSEDATHYLHQIAKADGIDTKVVNLYIGGCSLETHWRNIEENAKLYSYQRDGKVTEQYVSIKDALMEDEWDFVVTQQASHDSGLQETYYPYIHKLFQYIKEYAPKAERLLQETWAYEIDSTHDCFGRYNNNQQEMYEKLCAAYGRAAAELKVRIIPCGDVIQMVRSKTSFQYGKGGMSLCRDGFHMHYIYGRYLVAATWYEVIFGKSILDNTYIPVTAFAPDEEVDLNKLNLIKECVHETVENTKANLKMDIWMSSEEKPGDGCWYCGPRDIAYKLDKQEDFRFIDEDSSNVITMKINPDKKYQSILGMGISMEESTVYCLRRMSEKKRKEVLTKLVHPIEGIGINLIRVCIGTPDFTGRKFYTYDDTINNVPDPDLKHFSIQKDIEYGIIDTLKGALEINSEIKFFASPWTPPGWMKERNNEFSEDNEYNLKGGKLKTEYIETLAKYYCKFIEAYKEQGIPIYAITLQNEPQLEIDYPSCFITSEQEQKLAIALKKELIINNLNTRIWIFDHNLSEGIEFTKESLNSEEALNAVDGIAFHDYSGEPDIMGEVQELFPDKDVMLTERSLWGTYGADRIAKYFRNHAISYNLWVTMLDSNITPHQWLGTPGPTLLIQDAAPSGFSDSVKLYDNYWLTPEYYLLGQFSKFIKPGAKRIESNYGSVENITNVAFLNPDNTIVIVVINQTNIEQAIKIQCKDFKASSKVPGGTVTTFVFKKD